MPIENHIEAIQPTHPFLRWAGSKRKILPRLSEYWRSSYRRYVEPFAGCAALFFRIQPARAVLGDINKELIEVYQVVQRMPDALHDAISSLPAGEKNYYRIRKQNPSTLSIFDRAVRFVYLNRHCFNGIYRTNASGQFNVPFGGQNKPNIPSIETFRRCSLLLRRAVLRACDFGYILRCTSKGDFVYIDPPYAIESRRVFHEYGPQQFSRADLERLSAHLRRMDIRGVNFIVSYADCSEARDALRFWHIKRVRVRRHIAGFAGARRTAYELLATNIL